MTLFDKVSEDIKEAMKARDKVRLETLRNIKKVFLEERQLREPTTLSRMRTRSRYSRSLPSRDGSQPALIQTTAVRILPTPNSRRRQS